MSNTPYRSTILIVDDVPTNIMVLAEALNVGYRIIMASNGVDALKIAQKSPQPDIILLDVMMPEMNGYEVCERLKAEATTRDIPVIFVTSKGDHEDEAYGLFLGAVDYLTKPVEPAIVLARVSNHLALKHTREELARNNDLLHREKEMVEDIIVRIRSSAPFDNRYIRYFLSTVDRTAGDMIFSAFRPDGCQHVLVCDFSGHGLPAAIGGPLVSYIFYHLTAENQPLTIILTEINRTLEQHLPTQLYMAACALEISARRDIAHFWNHGLPEALIFHNEQVIHRIPSTSLPLGILETISPSPDGVTVPLDTNHIYIYSDGITEVHSPEGEQFGQARLESFLALTSQSKLDLEEICSALIKHYGNADLPDDATLIEIST